MKSVLYCFAVCTLAIGFTSCKTTPSQRNEEPFTHFMDQFAELKLPIVFDSILQYMDTYNIQTKDGSFDRVKTLHKDIDTSSFLPVFNYDTTKLILRQRAIYKYLLKNKFWLVVYTRELEAICKCPEEGYGIWLVLCTYTLNGNLVDTIFLYGHTFEYIEQLKAQITKDHIIKTHRYEHGELDESIGTFESDEYLSEFTIDYETGKILCISSQVRKVRNNYHTGKLDPMEPFRPCPCPPKCRH